MDNNNTLTVAEQRPGMVSANSELTLLGLLMNRWEQMGQVHNMLVPDDFFLVRHQWLWSIYQMAYRFDLHADLIVVKDMLRHAELLDEVGDDYLEGLAIDVPRMDNAKSYARLIKEAAGKRSLLAKLNGVAVLIDDNATLEEALDYMQQAVSGLRATYSQPEAATSIQVADDLLAEMSDDSQEVDVGYPQLSAMASYQLVRESYWAIIAHPGKGKSRLVTQIAYNVASQGMRVALMSNEASPKQVMRLMAKANADFTWQDRHGTVRHGIPEHLLRDYDPLEDGPKRGAYEAMVNSVYGLQQLPIDWLPNMPVVALAAHCHQRQQEGRPVDVVIVDSVNKTPEARSGDGYGAVSAAHAYMLDLALTGPLVIGVSNVNKAGEEKRPTKESPQFRDALYSFRVLSYLHVDHELQRPGSDTTLLEAGILKNNNGPESGSMTLLHDGASGRIIET